jgi:hypothetical protein
MRLATTSSVLLAIAAVLAGCGSSNSSDGSAPKPRSTNSSVNKPSTSSVATGLVGKWSTTNVCGDEVRAFRKAGVATVGREFLRGEYPGQVAGGTDASRGAKPKQHSHGFGADGAFASYDQNGDQVDDGAYQRVNDHTFKLGDPPVAVRYRIEGNNATFSVVIPHCKTKRCRKSTAYVVSAFFPHDYQRVR